MRMNGMVAFKSLTYTKAHNIMYTCIVAYSCVIHTRNIPAKNLSVIVDLQSQKRVQKFIALHTYHLYMPKRECLRILVRAFPHNYADVWYIQTFARTTEQICDVLPFKKKNYQNAPAYESDLYIR